MKIEKALSHFEWRLVNKDNKGKVTGLKNNLKPSQTDIEALNSIIEWKHTQESISMSKNESLAKLWIHQLMLLNSTEMYSAERSIQVVDEILNQSVYEWCLKLQDQIGLMHYKVELGKDEKYKDAIRNGNFTLMKKESEKHIDFLEDSFSKKPKEESIIKFVKHQINRIINKYDK